MNVVLMTSRSGSSLVCRILAEHGLRWQDKGSNPLQSARGGGAGYYTYEHPSIKAALKSCTHKDKRYQKWPQGEMVTTTNPRLDILKTAMENEDIDFFKAGCEFADLIKDWSDLVRVKMNFIKVYRPPEDIAASLERRGIGPYELGYEIACKRLQLMDTVPGITVATNMLIDRTDWEMSGIYEAIRSCGVQFSEHKILKAIQPEKFHV